MAAKACVCAQCVRAPRSPPAGGATPSPRVAPPTSAARSLASSSSTVCSTTLLEGLKLIRSSVPKARRAAASVRSWLASSRGAHAPPPPSSSVPSSTQVPCGPRASTARDTPTCVSRPCGAAQRDTPPQSGVRCSNTARAPAHKAGAGRTPEALARHSEAQAWPRCGGPTRDRGSAAPRAAVALAPERRRPAAGANWHGRTRRLHAATAAAARRPRDSLATSLA